MKREEKLKRATTTKDFIMLFTKQQAIRFEAVVAWYQIHHNNLYFFDERHTRRLFIDLYIKLQVDANSDKAKAPTIEAIRNQLANHVLVRTRTEAAPFVRELAEAAARNISLKGMFEIGKRLYHSYPNLKRIIKEDTKEAL